MTYDVVAVKFSGRTVRLIAEDKTLENAQAVVNMAVLRRGVEKEFYSEVPAGSYTDGDIWTGSRLREEA